MLRSEHVFNKGSSEGQFPVKTCATNQEKLLKGQLEKNYIKDSN